jgi:hypothetical protein
LRPDLRRETGKNQGLRRLRIRPATGLALLQIKTARGKDSEHESGDATNGAEWGVADLRGKDERERAQLIINNCAHPDYRDELQSYVDTIKKGHSPESLANAFAMHRQFLKTGDMRGTQWN